MRTFTICSCVNATSSCLISTGKSCYVDDNGQMYEMPTFLVFLARLVTSCVAENNQRHVWVEFHVDERMLFVRIVFEYYERRLIDSSGREGRRSLRVPCRTHDCREFIGWS